MSSSNIWKKVGIGAAITGGVVAGVALCPIFLGFGTAGIVGGSIAAGIQSIIGNVAAGSLFAVCTSLGMSGVFATSAAVGTILGAGGLVVYIKSNFSPEKDAELILATIENRDNPDLIIKLLEARFPPQREEIRKKYNELKNKKNNDDNNNENKKEKEDDDIIVTTTVTEVFKDGELINKETREKMDGVVQSLHVYSPDTDEYEIFLKNTKLGQKQLVRRLEDGLPVESVNSQNENSIYNEINYNSNENEVKEEDEFKEQDWSENLAFFKKKLINLLKILLNNFILNLYKKK